jgi:Glutamine synthetase
MQREHLVMFCYCDIAGQVRGKGFPVSQLPKRLRSGIGWTPSNIMLTAFGPIAPSPWGPFGDLLLVADPATEVEADFGDEHPREHFFLGDVLHTDGRPWECCPRTFLKSALAALEQQAGLRLLSAFEQEFYYEGAVERIGSAYSLDAMRRHSIFGEVFVGALQRAGVEPESYMPEYGPRQYEVTYAAASGIASADRAVIVRELARAAARSLGHRVSFSPAVTPDVVGNGVHVHMSLVDLAGRPVMYDAEAPHGLSETSARFVAGLLQHAPTLCAVTAPSVVSYLRLQPHRWSAAWSNVGYRDREACVRICPVLEEAGAPIAPQFNIEFRAADATASPYFALGALIYAGLDGIVRQLPRPSVTSVDPETIDERERARQGIQRLPQSLAEALDAFEADPATEAWFPPALHAAYLAHKRCEMQVMADLERDERCRRYREAY